jgi:hypothetical protein
MVVSGSLIESGMDVLMALLYAPGASGKPGEQIRGITRFEKLLFLLEKETEFKKYLDRDFQFEAYDYGPFSVEVFDHLEALEVAHLIETRTVESKHRAEAFDALEIESDTITDEDLQQMAADETKKLKIYKLTEKGMQVGKALFESMADEERRNLREMKTRFNSISLHRLLRYVYRHYPKETEESIIKEKVLK